MWHLHLLYLALFRGVERGAPCRHGCGLASVASNGGPWSGRGKTVAVPNVSSHFGAGVCADAKEIYAAELAREKMHMREDVPPLQRSA